MGNTNIDISSHDDDGKVRISWDNSDEDANHWSWRVYRQRDGESAYTLIAERLSQTATYYHDDYLAASNVNNTYAVVETTSVDAGQTVVEGSYSPINVTPTAEHYWLLHPTDSSKHLRIDHVSKDDFADEYDEVAIELIGRGRKYDEGDRWGYQGSLTCQLRDFGPLTAAQQKNFLLTLKREGGYVHLRNPFGDVIKTMLSGLSFSRIPGVGVRPYVDVSFRYSEVA